MHDLELIPRRWLEYEPPSTCHEPISTTLAAVGSFFAAAAAPAAATAGETALATSLLAFPAAAVPGIAVAAPTALTAGELAAVGAAGAGATAASYLPSLATIGEAATVAGTGLQVKAGLDQSAYQAAVARYEAQQLADKAGQEAAAGEQQAIQRQRQADYVSSRGRAVAAASGGGATDPTVLDIDTQLAEQGKYNALTSLYEGMSGARTANQQATIDLFRASGVERAAPLAAAGTVLAGLGSFADRRTRLKLLASSPTAAAYA